jgi:PKD repeat protein
MKNKKILIATIILGTMLLLTSGVAAIDENKTVIDEVDDVIDINGDIITSDPNIPVSNVDIEQIKYIRSDKQVTIELTVVGQIENRGSLLDLDFADEDFSIDTAGYTIVLISDEREYTITYVNNTCNLAYFDDFGNDTSTNLTDFTVIGDTLTINFDLDNPDEIYDTISGLTQYMKFDMADITSDTGFEDITLLFDEATDQPLSVIIFEYNDGTINNPINFSGLATGGTPPYSFKWDFGDGETSTDRNPFHIFEAAGDYDINVTVTDSDGTEAFDEVPVTILAGGNGNGADGEPNIMIFFAVIVVIAIVGVIVVIYIIRR